MKESEWNFQRINSMKISFYKSGELNGSSDVKIPLGSSAFLNIKYDDKYCFLWSISAKLHPCEINFNRATNYRQCFKELSIEGFDFSNGVRCSDVHTFEKLNTLSSNKLELNFYRDQKVWKQTNPH